MSQEEALLIEKCQEGDLANFAGLYDAYIAKIYRYVFYKTRHKETAEDLTSQVFLKALENIKKYEHEKASFSAWLYRIARNTIIDYSRTSKVSFNIDEIFDVSSGENVENKVEFEMRIKEVREYMKKLSFEQQEILLLRIWEGLSYSEIAQIMNKTEGSVKMMFSRVINELRENLGPTFSF